MYQIFLTHCIVSFFTLHDYIVYSKNTSLVATAIWIWIKRLWKWGWRMCWHFNSHVVISWARSGVVVWGTMGQAGRSWVRVPMRWIFFNVPKSSSSTVALGVDSVSNRNEYQESSWEVEGGRRVRLTPLPSPMSRLSRDDVRASTSHNPMGLHGLLQE
jgi:hypothetical protein